MKLKGNRIIVKQDKPQEVTPGGIFIPQTLQTARNVGEVIAVGETAPNDLMGKKVMFNLAASQNINHGEIKGKLIFVVDILATLN